MIFVFGSNEQGKHYGGAAAAAVRNFGAVLGQGFGPQGESFAIPTCAEPMEGQEGAGITLDKIKDYVDMFIAYAVRHPERVFKVTQIGCGIAGWTKEQIAPLFAAAPSNCTFDTDWQPFFGNAYNYWGHV